ncbi:hypothetical protein JIN77_01810 [Verrucomicrobiaceae bacterium R5-34]|nr:hypothetical protein [Verrucomicrobiaceae bacterium R5-34]
MKNPFAEQDYSIISVMLVGVIVLVFVGLGAALLSESSSHLMSGPDTSMLDQNSRLKSQVAKLEVRLEKRSREILAASHNREQARRVEELKNQSISALKEAETLRALIAGEKEAIKLIAKAKEAHRLEYRDYVRGEAIGKSYEKITTRLGKDYHDVRVTDVTPLGVSITHRTGAVMLGFRQIPVAWQRGLMFTAAEMAEAAKAEQKRQTMARNQIDRRVRANTKTMKSQELMREKASLRRQIASLNIKLTAANFEASLARNKLSAQESLRNSRTYSSSSSSYYYYNTSTGAYYSTGYRPRYRSRWIGSKSVPGSLETWDQRAAKFERAAAQYTAKLTELTARLKAIP